VGEVEGEEGPIKQKQKTGQKLVHGTSIHSDASYNAMLQTYFILKLLRVDVLSNGQNHPA
jgi:hypothetical protein